MCGVGVCGVDVWYSVCGVDVWYRCGHSMSIQPLILGHVLRFTYHFPYLLGMMYYALLQSIAYSMMFVYKIWSSEYLIFW